MNPLTPLLGLSKLFLSAQLKSRLFLPSQQAHSFGPSNSQEQQTINGIYVINLERQPDRWTQVSSELDMVLDSSGISLAKRAKRHSAIDARSFEQLLPVMDVVNPFYTLSDQLFVEPQPLALPDRLELDHPIRMSLPEIAVALSHISVWRSIAEGEHAYALVLEDDVWFRHGFARSLDRAWLEMQPTKFDTERFDVLYLSYREAKGGAPKTFVSPNVFRPVRGLWFLSGYVLSRSGAEKLLKLLPCRGPVDLWMNQQFAVLDVRATKQSIISQRGDGSSTNSYSIIPILTKIGVLDGGGESLFQIRPRERPVFAFGPEGSGISSLAMGLSMLGYRCCSDVDDLPASELEHLLSGRTNRVFDAYVNIGALREKLDALTQHYPEAKFIFTTPSDDGAGSEAPEELARLSATSVVKLSAKNTNKWKVVCEHLGCPPPACPFPELQDVGQRQLVIQGDVRQPAVRVEKRDKSPWVVEARRGWKGVRTSVTPKGLSSLPEFVFTDYFESHNADRWLVRDDTFPSNLAMFRPSNAEFHRTLGAVLSVKNEPLGVRSYSAGAISSRDRFLYGKFEVVLQATKVAGIVTGFFLHRDTPRQEIDVEIVGNHSDWLLINVFYNPGSEGASVDYGYRGAPSRIKLGFDASAAPHRYTIEWGPSLIRWLVDGLVVHERANWDPTPIPHLPMTLHANTWPSRSRQLAGRLDGRKLPVSAVIKSISVESNAVD